MSYRDYLSDAPGGLFYSVPNVAAGNPTTNAPLSAMQVQSGPTPTAAYNQFMSYPTPPSYGASSGNGANAGPSNAVSVGPSNVTGVGMGSMATNFRNGDNIAAAMGLASVVPGVGTFMGIPGLMNMLGIQGLMNNIKVSNGLSTNNVRNDVQAVEEAMGIDVNPNDPTPDPDSTGVGVGSTTGVGPGTAPSAAPSGAAGANPGDPSPSSADSGSGSDGNGNYSHGGRVYRRFAGGGEVHAFDEAFKAPTRRPLRKAYQREFPGIWEDPRAIAAEANERVAPEDSAMGRLFGYNREALYDEFANRKGNVEGRSLIALPAKPRGSEAAQRLMTPGNAQRLIDTLAEAGKYPDLRKGMDNWYTMDPVHQRLTEMEGGDQADRLYRRFNTLSGMASPGSEVMTELNRGTAANSLAERGRFHDFDRFAGLPAEERGIDFPSDMSHVLGHPYHPTAMAGPMRRFMDTDEVNMTKPKVPLYIGASGVPSTGFQTDMPVPDSHFARGIGLADTRTDANYGRSLSMPEFADIGPWYRDKVAAPLGLESVSAQARQWGTFGHATGVDTAIGAPKLELLSRHIMNRAHELGVSPETMRDGILTGRLFARGGVVDHLPPLR